MKNIASTVDIKGDIEQFTLFFEQFRPKLHAKALQMLGCTHEAQDAVQDSFITAFSKIHQLNDIQSFNKWLVSILINHCLMYKRKQKKVLLNNESKTYINFNKGDEAIERLLLEDDLNKNLIELLSKIDSKKRIVLIIRYFSEFNSYDEIANILGISTGTVKSRLFKAKEQLFNMIQYASYSREGGMENHYNQMFQNAWKDFYNGNRSRFLSLFSNDLNIRFSSGKHGFGIDRWAQEWEIDLESGARFLPNYVLTSGNITIVEGPIVNPPENPDFCPPAGSFVFFHEDDLVHTTHIHYAPRNS